MNQHTDMRPVIVPKSDQLNAEDLMGGDRTITITEARVNPGTEQPVIVNYEGDNGRPYKPCKTMCRLMVKFWGPDSANYTGKRLTLYYDPEVRWGNVKVGGIRISHMSDIDRVQKVALTETRGKRKEHVVKPLGPQTPVQREQPQEGTGTGWGDENAASEDTAAASDAMAGEVRRAIDAAKGQKSWTKASDLLAAYHDNFDAELAHELQMSLDAKRVELGG